MNKTISAMVTIRDELQRQLFDKEDVEIRSILKLVENYLQTHCKHCWICDYVDINPDRSKKIFYCSHCFSSDRH